jgi:hypothetical protein
LAAFAWTSEVVSLPRVGALIAIVVGSVLVFLTISVLVQGWELYLDRTRPFEVVALTKDANQDLGSEWVIVLRGPKEVEAGSILQITRRLQDGVEVPFAVVRTTGKNASGHHQGIPIWVSSGHLNDFKKQKFSVLSLLVERNPSIGVLEKVSRELEQRTGV